MKKWTEEYRTEDLILFENKDFIVINKPPGVKTQDDPTEGISLTFWLNQLRDNTYHVTNRLDRPVSGGVLFSKSSKGNRLAVNQDSGSKVYIAVINKMEQVSGDLHHFISRDGQSKKAHVDSEKHPGFKPCHLHYELVHQLDRYSVLQIIPSTGRFHQIRAQFAHIGYPIRGDVKYGAKRSNKDRSIDLHAVRVIIPGINKKIVAPPLRSDGLWRTISELDIFQAL